MAAQKKKTGAKRKPAHSRPHASSKFRNVLITAMRGVVNMAVVATVSAAVLGGLLAAKYYGA